MDRRNIEEIVQGLDSTPGIMEPRIGRWCVWPIVKPEIFMSILRQHWTGAESDTSSSRWSKKIKRLFGLLRPAAIGVSQLLYHMSWRKKPQIIFLSYSSDRSERLTDGRYLDIFFDDLILSGNLKYDTFVVENPANWGHITPTAGPCHLYEEPVMLTCMLVSKSLRLQTNIAPVVSKMVDLLFDSNLPLSEDLLEDSVRNALADFKAKRQIFGNLFRHRNAKSLLVLDSDSVPGQMAAAKELGIPVLEFQHGSMGGEHIGYQWHGSLKSYKGNMPIPDAILVYGKFWQDMLIRKGFWARDEIIPVGSARMDRFRSKQDVIYQTRKNDSLKILFTTQWTSRPASIPFLSHLLRALELEPPINYELVVKVHPGEKDYMYLYQILESKSPKRCKVIFDEDDTFSLMLKSDVHVSYYSTSLLESVALGVLSVSICGGPSLGGIAGVMHLPELQDLIVHVDSVEALVDQLSTCLPGSEKMKKWKERTFAAGERLFATGFIEKASQAINRKAKA